MNTASTSDDPLGLSGAISTLVSNKVRAGNAWPARLAVRVVNDVQVVRYVGLMLPILVASNFLDGLQLLEDAVDKKWVLLSFINLGSYYVIAVPSGIVQEL
ncbi:protein DETOXIFICATION 16-like [Arachis hypogaea]|uniref:protein DETOXIFICATION 16-like n=1 Tax=Arachis hypogaea TaxID=3818 RepID=UPI003B211BCA